MSYVQRGCNEPTFLPFCRTTRTYQPFLPLSHGIPRVDDLKVISGIIYVIKHGLQWKDAPREYGPYKTLYNRFLRWSRMGVFNNIFTELAKTAGKDGQLMAVSSVVLLMRPTSKPIVPQRVCLKKGSFPLYRTHKRRTELKTPCGLRRSRQARGHDAHRRSGERLQRRRLAYRYFA